MFHSRFAAVLFILVAGLKALSGQTTSSTLDGTITDPQGAAVPKAKVQAVNVLTGQNFWVVADDRGHWVIAALPTSIYKVTVTSPGFRTETVDRVKIDAGVPATVNMKLEVGALTETVEVTGGSEVLQTATAAVSSTMTGRQINELPFTGRNALELILTQPGTQTPGGPRTSSINGLPKGGLNITVDGLNVQDNLLKSNDGFFTSIQPRSDAIEEVTLTTAAAGAESLGEGSAQVKFVTKSGTNEFHGGLFWQHRNTVFNSNYYFNNIDGLPRDRIILNQAGGRLGGPIRKNRIFFFASFEEFRLPQTTASPVEQVLTTDARNGIFTYQDSSTRQIRKVNLYALAAAKNPSLPASVRAYPTTPDPTVASTLALIDKLTSASGNLQSRIIKNSDYNRNDYNFQANGANNRNFPTVRLDANLTSKHHLEFVYNYQTNYRVPDGLNGIIPIFAGTGTVLGSDLNVGQRSIAFSGVTALRSTLTPTLTGEARFGLLGGISLFREEISPSVFAPWNGYATFYNNFIQHPYNARSQSRRNTPLEQASETLSWSRGSHLLNFGGNFTQVHSWQQGTDFQVIPRVTFSIATNDPVNTGATSIFDTVNFPNSTPTNRSDAAALYAVLTGRISAIDRLVGLDEKTHTYGSNPTVDRNRQREFGMFIQDSWRVRRGLTFNYGLRLDRQLPFVNTSGTYTRAGIESVYGISGVGNIFKPGILTGTTPQYTSVDSGTQPYHTSNNYSPSVGFAWVLPHAAGPLGWLTGRDGQSVVRSGYSIATIREGMNTFISIWGSNPGSTVSTSVTPGNFPVEFGPPGSVLFRDPILPSRPGPSKPTFPIPAQAGVSINEFDPNLKVGYVQSWTFSFQREVTRNTVIDVRYVGNHGTKLWRQINVNEVNIFENGFLDEFKVAVNNLAIAQKQNASSVNFGNQGLPGQKNIPIISTALALTSDVTTATQLIQGQAGALANGIAFNATRMARLTAANYPANLFVANPTVGSSGSFLVTNGGNSTFNALQVELRRRLTAGLQVQGSYSWSKALSNVQASSSVVFDQLTTLRDSGLDKGPSPWDIRHGFKVNWIYELPFGHGRALLSNISQPVLRKAVEGWEIAAVTRVQSGSPDYLRSGRQTFNSASSQSNSADAGVVLHNITAGQLQDMVHIRKDPGTGVVYFLPQTLIDNTLAAFEVGGKTLNDLDPNKPYIGPPTTAGQLGYRIFLYGPWQNRYDLSILKRTAIGEKKNLEFRAQFLDAFNLTNFLLGGAGNDVNTSPINSSFGQTRSAFRDVSNTNDPGGRIIEFVLRFNF